jgi:GNAT superfamily N-acetyltransferase
VVVDGPARGQDVSAALVGEAVRLAREHGAVRTDLLSHDRRRGAIRLHRRLGFERFETNVFRLVHPAG